MGNEIDNVFFKGNRLKLMTHVVAGYPDLETSKKIIQSMATCGVDLVEIQIPFSDPLADGPTIMAANQQALDNGVTPDDCFKMARELKEKVDIPLLFMTYTNVAFCMGMERFVSESAACGIDGLIIPDLPFDEDNQDYVSILKKYSLYPIWVVSSDIKTFRLKRILKIARGFIYITLRVGITGAVNVKAIEPESLTFIKKVRQSTSIPIAAGFGISSPAHVRQLQDKVDIAVIGSHIIDLLNQYGTEKVEEFITQCR
jgi:tryptophan synthase alpha chain